jgi:type II secretory ATPase GspE/PulE/Tfp pilus assembly ATPase PilB-like protein
MSHIPNSRVPKEWRSHAAIDKANGFELDDLMAMCQEEPADFEGCLPCYAYKVAQNREAAEARREAEADAAESEAQHALAAQEARKLLKAALTRLKEASEVYISDLSSDPKMPSRADAELEMQNALEEAEDVLRILKGT